MPPDFEKEYSALRKRTEILFIVVFALIALLTFQMLMTSGTSGGLSGTSKEEIPDNQVQDTKKQLIANTFALIGEVASFSSTELVIKANLVDLNKLDGFDYNKSFDLPMVKKNFTVKITKDTKINIEDGLRNGLMLSVITKEPVYSSPSLTAISISLFNIPPAFPSP